MIYRLSSITSFVAIFIFLISFGISDVYAAIIDVAVNADGSFTPSTVTINTGDTVRWTENGSGDQVSSDNHPSHTLYPDPACPNASCWDSPVMSTNNTYSFTFWVGASWDYHNHVRPGKTGVVNVTDLNAPATTTNLAASNATANSIDLSWTSPGDDVGATGNFLTPTTYDIRYSTSAITAGNWASATQATGEPTPQVAGSSQSMTVSGLSSLTTYYFALKTRDEVPNESGLSNVVSLGTTASSDTTAPAAITNLTTSSPTGDSIVLSWTAPGDDGSTGTASTYDVRYSTLSITDGNWSSAIQATGEPTPLASGSSQTMTVSGLTLGTLYYFAVKTSDEAPNVSGLSNVATGATLARATRERISDFIYPGAISDLSAKAASATSITLSWTAPGDDDFSGTSTSYDIRYSREQDFLLSDAIWSFGLTVSNPPTPKPAGSAESLRVSGLETGTVYYFGIKAVDEASNYGRMSNVASVWIIAPDVTPPLAISDLAFTQPSISAVALTWTASGDDEAVGRAVRYDIRYTTGTTTLSEASWPSAISFIDPPVPVTAGSGESFTVVGLSHATTYHIAIKAFDEEGNASYISNLASFTTLPEPEVRETAEEEEQRKEPQLPSTVLEGDVVRVTDDPKVYVIIGGKRLWIPRPEGFERAGYSWDSIKEISAGELALIQPAVLVRAEDGPEVYVFLEVRGDIS